VSGYDLGVPTTEQIRDSIAERLRELGEQIEALNRALAELDGQSPEATAATGVASSRRTGSPAPSRAEGGDGRAKRAETARAGGSAPPTGGASAADGAKARGKTDGAKATGAKATGAKATGAKTEGAKATGAKAEGAKATGAKTDGIKTTDAAQPTDGAKATDGSKATDAAEAANGGSAARSRRPARRSQGRRPRRAVEVVPAGKLEHLLGQTAGLTTVALATQANGDPTQVLTLLRELEVAGRVRRTGQRRGTRWFVITDEDRIRARAAELAAMSRRSS
jgi:hypothetical protein